MRPLPTLAGLLLLGIAVFWLALGGSGPEAPERAKRPAHSGEPALRGAGAAAPPPTKHTPAAAALRWPRTVQGRVVLPKGVPAHAARVWTSRGGSRNHDHNAIDGHPLEIDAQGGFKFEIDEPDSYEAGHPQVVEAAATHEGQRLFGATVVESGQPAVIVSLGPLRPGDPAMVRVRGLGPLGEPVGCSGHGWIDALGHPRHDYRGTHEADGEPGFVFWFLWDPHAKIYVKASPDESGLAAVHAGPFDASLTDLELTFNRAWSLRGTLVDARGRAVAGAAMVAEAAARVTAYGHVRYPSRRISAKTDASGRFAFGAGDLSSEPYTLYAECEVSRGALPPTRVAPVSADLHLSLEDVATRRVQVHDPSGNAVSEARVVVMRMPAGFDAARALPPAWRAWRRDEAPLRHLRTDTDGVASLRGLHADAAYVLIVRAPEGRADLGDLEVEGWRPQDEAIRLERGLTIEGRIEQPEEGAPYSWWDTTVRPLDPTVQIGTLVRHSNGATTRRELRSRGTPLLDGRVALGPLPPGRYAVRAYGGVEQIIEAGARDVVLRGRSLWGHGWLVLRIEHARPSDRGALAVLSTGGLWRQSQHVEADGGVGFVHVAGHTPYDVWIGGLDGGRYVWARGVRASDSDYSQALVAQQGGRIEGRVVGPTGVPLEGWSLDPVGPVAALQGLRERDAGCPYVTDAASGRFVIEGVPPGTWTIRARMRADDEQLLGQAEASEGQRVVIQLRRQR